MGCHASANWPLAGMAFSPTTLAGVRPTHSRRLPSSWACAAPAQASSSSRAAAAVRAMAAGVRVGAAERRLGGLQALASEWRLVQRCRKRAAMRGAAGCLDLPEAAMPSRQPRGDRTEAAFKAVPDATLALQQPVGEVCNFVGAQCDSTGYTHASVEDRGQQRERRRCACRAAAH